jgi:predicted permease
VIGPIVDVIVVGFFFVVLAIYFRFVHVHADVKDKAFFGIFFATGIFLGLPLEAMSLIVAPGVENRPWFNHLSMYLAGIYIYMFAGLLLAFLMGYFLLISFLGGDKFSSRFQAVLGVYDAGLLLGYFMSLLLTVANWGLQEGARPKLLSVMLAFCLSGTVAYFPWLR